jgi:hypothetical protein
MRKFLFGLSILGAVAGGLPSHNVFAQQPATAAAAEEMKHEPSGTVIPEVDFKNTLFSDVIQFLRDVDKSFQCVVSYNPGAEGGPSIQEMKLRNVTAESVLELLTTAYPQIHASMDSSARYWIIRVEGEPTRGGDQSPQAPRVMVHRLREIVDDLLRRPDAEQSRKKALESIMSLVSNLTEVDGGDMNNVRLQLHEATETLAVKGADPLLETVAAALASLRPSKDAEIKAAQNAEYQRSVFEDQLRERTVNLEAATRALNNSQARIAELEKLLEASKKPETKPAAK